MEEAASEKRAELRSIEAEAAADERQTLGDAGGWGVDGDGGSESSRRRRRSIAGVAPGVAPGAAEAEAAAGGEAAAAVAGQVESIGSMGKGGGGGGDAIPPLRTRAASAVVVQAFRIRPASRAFQRAASVPVYKYGS